MQIEVGWFQAQASQLLGGVAQGSRGSGFCLGSLRQLAQSDIPCLHEATGSGMFRIHVNDYMLSSALRLAMNAECFVAIGHILCWLLFGSCYIEASLSGV